MYLFKFLEKKFQNGAHLKKQKQKLFLTHYFLVTKEKPQKFVWFISHLHKYTYLAGPTDFIFTNFVQKITNLSCIA